MGKMISSKKSSNQDSLAMVLSEPQQLQLANATIQAPIIASYNDKIRPLLDVVDRLRNLNVMKEGIQLPTIVVVGDQSSGKSSVLESLAGISLPRGQGICTRVPLVMRLQHHQNSVPEIYLEFNGKSVKTDEDRVAEDICVATDEIAGDGKGISNAPLTLVVKKAGVPDLTMVDLPGITRVPVHGQPDNIYELIADMIMEYIKPEESIILNVLSASVDFSTCESIRMSRKVDGTGERTLAVVTKADRTPEGLREKILADDVSIGLGYVCVRNRIGDETYEEAREQESILFDTHPLLSQVDKEIVGVPILASRLMQIQAVIIARCLPETVKKITDKLNANIAELNSMPKTMSSLGEAMVAFMQMIGSSKDSLRKILVRGEFDEFPDDHRMHCTARLADMFNQFLDELRIHSKEKSLGSEFLMDEIRVLEEGKGIGLPNFLPRSAFLSILAQKVGEIHDRPVRFIADVWDYIEEILLRVLMEHSVNYPQLQSATRRAACNLISKSKNRSKNIMIDMVETEKLTDYTSSSEYITEWNDLMKSQEAFINAVLHDPKNPNKFVLEGFGEVEISHLRSYPHLIRQAFDLKMRMAAYWKIVVRRLVDNVALHVQYHVMCLVNREMEKEIVEEMVGNSGGCGSGGGGIHRMLEETPAVANKRERLKNSIKLLQESKDVVAKVIDKVSTYGD